jgi:hypothetical protein
MSKLLRCLVAVAIVAVSVTSLTACGTTSEAAVDRHDPASVLRAYFDAWAQGDWSGQTSFMDKMYSSLINEPVESISNVTIRRLDSEPSAGRARFSVGFDIVVKGTGVSMHTGHYDWRYELTWDQDRDSWLIASYGEA